MAPTMASKPPQPVTQANPAAPMFPVQFPTKCNQLEVPPFGQYYVYASGPKPASSDRPKNKGTGKPHGAHDYHSMIWDPHIFRGPTYKTYKKSEEERCKRKLREDAESSNDQRKKGLAKRRAQQQRNLGGIARPKTPSNQSNKVGLEDMGVQTDKFLEEITEEVIEKNISTQTEHIFDLVISPLFCPIKLGVDNSTQIQPWELFSFDEEAKPITTTVVGKIIEQALLETMEEVELESLVSQQRAYEERNRIELVRLERMHKREQKITDERERLIAQREKEVAQERETEAIINATLYAANYLGDMANGTLGDLRTQGFMRESDGLQKGFIPWLHNTSIQQLFRQESSRKLLDEIIQEVVAKKEAEVAAGIYREVSARPETDITESYSHH